MLGDCGGPAVWALLCVGVPQGRTESGGVGLKVGEYNRGHAVGLAVMVAQHMSNTVARR